MVKQQHQFFVALLSVSDAAVVCAASMAAWMFRRIAVDGYFPPAWEDYFKGPLLAFTVPVTVLMLWSFRMYRPRRDRSVWEEQVELGKASLASLAGIVVALWLTRNDLIVDAGDFARVTILGRTIDAGQFQLGALAILLPASLAAHRLLFRLALRLIRRRGWNLRYAAIVGVGRLGQIACRTIERNGWTGIQVAYFLSHHERTKRTHCLGKPVLGGLDDLERVLRERKVDAVYLALPTSRAALVPQLLHRLEKYAVDVRLIPDVSPRYVPHSMVVSELDGMPILSYRECPMRGLGGLTKRAIDAAGALGALVLFSPVLLTAAALVRCTSPGPVIFRQRRVSLGGEEFNIYKFRTMYSSADERDELTLPAGSDGTSAWTRRDDPRITPVGRWLRRLSIDELPQLFNVLKGDMSLVGPRPERPELIERFREDWRGYMLRQQVKAGMTGWAQVNGLRGHSSLRKRLQYDLFYIRHWSLGFDLRILWLTVFRGFVNRNAH